MTEEEYNKAYAGVKAASERHFDERDRLQIVMGISTNRLRELATADAEGRVWVLPAIPHSELFWVDKCLKATGTIICKGGYNCHHCSSDCQEYKEEIVTAGYEIYKGYFCPDEDTISTIRRELGKTVFLTEQEAKECIIKLEAARALSEASAGEGEK